MGLDADLTLTVRTPTETPFRALPGLSWLQLVLADGAAYSQAIALITALPYNWSMRTVTETFIFERYATDIWSNSERETFIT